MICFMPTTRCEMRCMKCYWNAAPKYHRKQPDMTWNEFTDAVIASAQYSLHGPVVFSGGEPSLWMPLVKAIDYLKDMGFGPIRVLTHGVDRNMENYGNADLVQVSHYGAQNCVDAQRLKKQGGKRVRIQYPAHVNWPYGDEEADYPDHCGCAYPAFFRDQVYMCPHAVAIGEGDHCSVKDWDPAENQPLKQGICRRCNSNHKLAQRHRPCVTMSWYLWDSGYGIHIPWPFRRWK